MKYSLITALALAAIMLAGCGEDDDDKQYYPGYISPGDFRLQGILDDKAYSFAFLPTAPTNERCGPSPDCLAVYTNWPSAIGNNTYLPLEGVAISDRNRANPVIEMKIYRLEGTDWTISLVYKGVEYTGSARAGDITITFSLSTVESLPPYVSYAGETLPGSGIYVTRAAVTFNTPINLTNSQATPTTRTIGPGDSIVAFGNKVY